MAQRRIPKKIIEKVREYLDSIKADKVLVKQVFIFGSYARGTNNQWSDVDLCVVSPAFKDAWEATQYLWRKIPMKSIFSLEPIGFSPKDFAEDSSLISQIKKTGVRII